MSDSCRICIETNYTNTINNLHQSIGPSFEALTAQLQRFIANTNDTDAQDFADGILAKTEQLNRTTITANDVEDFYFYYVTRGVYALLGADRYVKTYNDLTEPILTCQSGADFFNLTCPEPTTNQSVAVRALLRHADTVFSSVTTAGAPFPLWSKGDGTGELFKGNSPVGGSGVDMSGNLFSLFQYALTPRGPGEYVDPSSDDAWSGITKNPVYA